MTTQNARAFNEWLRAQLKAKKMSQRQLAQQSGVDHSTISRLIRGDRMPSLGTATKLARGLRELRDDADTPQYLGLVAAGNTNPAARVEYALRADELLRELRDDADTPQYLGLVAAGNTNPAARVEYALRADELLSEPQVRQIMEYYLAVRMRRYGRSFKPPDVDSGTDRAPERTMGRHTASASPMGVGAGAGSAVSTVRPISRSVGRDQGRY